MTNGPGATPYQGGVPRTTVTVHADAHPGPGVETHDVAGVIVDSGANESMLRWQDCAGMKLGIVGVVTGETPTGRMSTLKIEFTNGGWAFKADNGGVEATRTCNEPFAIGANKMLGNEQLAAAGCSFVNRPGAKTGRIYVE